MSQAQSVPRARFFQGFTTGEIVILAVLGVVLGVGGTPMAILFRFLNTAGGEAGWALSASILGWFYLAGVLGGYIVRKPGAATLCEVISGAVFALIGVGIIAAVAKAGVLRGTALDREARAC